MGTVEMIAIVTVFIVMASLIIKLEYRVSRLRKLCDFLEDKVRKLRIINDNLSAAYNGLTMCNEDLYKREIELVRLASQGHQNLSVLEIENPDNGHFALIGRIDNEPMYIVIKKFEYDTADSEDREFALREAEELKETIEKW